MRRLPTLVIVLLLVFGLLAVAPVSALGGPNSGLPVYVAIPDYIELDGQIDQIIFMGGAGTEIAVINCLPSGDYETQPMMIRDKTAGVHGHLTTAIPYMAMKPGTRATDLVFEYTCSDNGVSYNVYSGVAN